MFPTPKIFTPTAVEAFGLRVTSSSSCCGFDLFSKGCNCCSTWLIRKSPAPRAANTSSPAVRFKSGAILNRSEEHTSELQSRFDLVCRLLLEKKKQKHNIFESHEWSTENRASCSQHQL